MIRCCKRLHEATGLLRQRVSNPLILHGKLTTRLLGKWQPDCSIPHRALREPASLRGSGKFRTH